MKGYCHANVNMIVISFLLMLMANGLVLDGFAKTDREERERVLSLAPATTLLKAGRLQ